MAKSKAKSKVDAETDAAVEAAEAEVAAEGGTGEADAVEVVTGPRVKLEDGPFVSVGENDVRERRLLLNGHNYEHVSEVVDQGETVWVYRQM